MRRLTSIARHGRRRRLGAAPLASLLLLSLLLPLLLAPAALGAQTAGGGPPRPRLAAGADTNDAVAYFEYGNLAQTPWKKSQDAYYWAYRLDPRQPVFLLAQWQAQWMKQDQGWRNAYREGAKFATESKASKELDSLYALIVARDPFAHFSGSTCYVPSWIDEVDDLAVAGWVYYDGMCYKQAAEQWGKVLAKRPGLAGLRIDRAKALHYSGSNGLAIQELQTALDTLRARDDKRLRHFYESKEWIEYMVGLIQQEEENYAAARAAYGRALAENLSFYQAHARLGDVAMLKGDVATAVVEYDQAVQLRGDDPVLRDNYGVALLQSGKARLADAEAQFRKAVELAPDYANPYYNLAAALTNQGKYDDAVAQYRAFISRAPRGYAGMIESANRNIATIQSAVAAAGGRK